MLAILTAELRAAIRWLTGQLRSIFQIVQEDGVWLAPRYGASEVELCSS